MKNCHGVCYILLHHRFHINSILFSFFRICKPIVSCQFVLPRGIISGTGLYPVSALILRKYIIPPLAIRTTANKIKPSTKFLIYFPTSFSPHGQAVHPKVHPCRLQSSSLWPPSFLHLLLSYSNSGYPYLPTNFPLT